MEITMFSSKIVVHSISDDKLESNLSPETSSSDPRAYDMHCIHNTDNNDKKDGQSLVLRSPSLIYGSLISVRWRQMVQVKATSILLLGDFVKRDHGKVEMFPVPDSLSLPTAGTEGPSIPEPVVHPLPAAALSTSPIAAS
ncbi:hypothetical protein CR513_56489, partial [Mucuna pruriens]